jgi:uncharacterized protein
MAAVGGPSGKPRLHEIDFVRGAALFGILVVNIGYYGLPMDVAGGVPAPDDRPGLFAWGVVSALFEFKFFSIFSLLFGMSLALQRESLLASRGSWIPPILRRHGFLLVVGVLHGVGLFYLDILLPYAVLGTLALVAFRLPARMTAAIAIGLLAIAVLLSALGETSKMMQVSRAPVGVEPMRAPVTLETITPAEERSLASIELRVFREGPMWAALAVRGMEYSFWLALSTFASGFNARVLALMLLGIVLQRAGALGERFRPVRRRVCLMGWLIGLPIEIACTILFALDPDRGSTARLALGAAHEIGSLALAAGIATTLVAWAQSAFASRLRTRIAAAGRMAFTNYLSQSIVANLVFTGLGLAWFGRLTRVELLGCALVLYAVQVVTSGVWLARVEMGPLEWIWRCVTHLGVPSRGSAGRPPS